MSVTAAEGFVASGYAAGIKPARRDTALLATDDGRAVPSAAVFTQNKFRAPPVEASFERLEASGGMAAGVIVNSGNANAGTGAKGRADSRGDVRRGGRGGRLRERRDAGLLDRADRISPADAARS